MNTKHLAFMYLLFRIIDAHAEKFIQQVGGPTDDPYARLKLFMDTHDDTDINQQICLALPVLTAIEGKHKNALAEFWNPFIPVEKTFIPQELPRFFCTERNMFNRVFIFDLNTIFLTEEFHMFCGIYEKTGINEIASFLNPEAYTFDKSLSEIEYMIDESVAHLANKKDFFEIIKRPIQYAKSFTHVNEAFKGASQYFDTNGILLPHEAQNPKGVYNYIINRITNKGDILVPV